jgi:hypothetical protein
MFAFTSMGARIDHSVNDKPLMFSKLMVKVIT